MVPRAGPLSASSAWATTSWYQRGKSWARGGGRDLAMGGEARGWPRPYRARFPAAEMLGCQDAGRVELPTLGPSDLDAIAALCRRSLADPPEPDELAGCLFAPDQPATVRGD